jgi:hypothetical protein
MDSQMPFLNHLSMLSPKEKTCLWARGLFGLSKDLGPKRHLNIWRKDESKKKRAFMKMKEGGVHHKKHDGHCMK